MIHAQGMVEASVRGPWIDQVSQSELADVTKALEGRRIDDADRRGIESDGVPDWIPDHLKARGL
jgi:hypothetical protein